MVILLQALMLAFIFEGIGFALFPGKMRQAMLQVASLSDADIRSLGCVALVLAILTGVASRFLL